MAISLLPPEFDEPEAPVPPVSRAPQIGAQPSAKATATSPPHPAVPLEHALPAAGRLLRYAPQMTLRDLAARTRLPQDELAALDRGDTSHCGGDFYLRAHLTCIASALQVEPDVLLLSFDRRPPARMPDGTLGLRAPVHHRRRSAGRRLLWSAMVLVLLAAVGLAGYQWKTGKNGTTGTSAAAKHTRALSAPPVRHPAAQKKLQPPPPIPPGTVVVALAATGGPTWLLAQDQTGATLFEGTVPAGSTQLLRGASVHAVIGNAGAVIPTCNYHRGAVLGSPGQVVTTTFAPGTGGC